MPYENKLLTPARIDILKYLAAYKFGTTNQINSCLQITKVVQHTLGDLAKLRQLGMVRSFPIEASQGGRSMLCWLLQREGAYSIGLPYNSHFDREPSQEQILYRDWQIELERAVFLCEGWTLIKPQTFSRAHPAPETTPQHDVLQKAVEHSRYSRVQYMQRTDPHHPKLGDMIENYNAKMWTVATPKQANDYVAYRNAPVVQAVTLILAPKEATNKLWKQRIELYKWLKKEIPVIVVFGRESQAFASRDYIKENGLKVTTPLKLVTMLEEIERLGSDYWQAASG